MENKDNPIITMYKYIERTHIQQFIRDKIETNLEAFENESSRPNDYQGISISGQCSVMTWSFDHLKDLSNHLSLFLILCHLVISVI